jgi:isoleucyl-tRNA synthetase
MAPILSFTAEELWRVFAKEESVFLTTWHEVPAPADGAELMAKWTRLRELRNPVRKQIEDLRADGKVGSSLQAELTLRAPGSDYDLLASLEKELKFLMMTSSAAAARGDALAASVVPSDNPKCERCWHYVADVNGDGLCGRCQTNLQGPGETRRYV